MHKKTIALVNRYVPINNKIVSGNVLMRATPIRKTAEILMFTKNHYRLNVKKHLLAKDRLYML